MHNGHQGRARIRPGAKDPDFSFRLIFVAGTVGLLTKRMASIGCLSPCASHFLPLTGSADATAWLLLHSSLIFLGNAELIDSFFGRPWFRAGNFFLLLSIPDHHTLESLDRKTPRTRASFNRPLLISTEEPAKTLHPTPTLSYRQNAFQGRYVTSLSSCSRVFPAVRKSHPQPLRHETTMLSTHTCYSGSKAVRNHLIVPRSGWLSLSLTASSSFERARCLRHFS